MIGPLTFRLSHLETTIAMILDVNDKFIVLVLDSSFASFSMLPEVQCNQFVQTFNSSARASFRKCIPSLQCVHCLLQLRYEI